MRISKTICDLCKKNDINEDGGFIGINIPVLTECDWTEGRSVGSHIEFCKFDICDDCMMKITRVKCGFQGSEPEIIYKYKEFNYTDYGDIK